RGDDRLVEPEPGEAPGPAGGADEQHRPAHGVAGAHDRALAEEVAVEDGDQVVGHVAPVEAGVLGRAGDAVAAVVEGDAAVPVGHVGRQRRPHPGVEAGGVRQHEGGGGGVGGAAEVVDRHLDAVAGRDVGDRCGGHRASLYGDPTVAAPTDPAADAAAVLAANEAFYAA